MSEEQDFKGSIMSKEEEEWMKNHEKERFGRVLERDVNGDPIGEMKEK